MNETSIKKENRFMKFTSFELDRLEGSMINDMIHDQSVKRDQTCIQLRKEIREAIRTKQQKETEKVE